MNPYEDAARNAAIRGLNSATVWDEHPSYNDKTSVMRGLVLAQGALAVIQEAEGAGNVVAGVDLDALWEVTKLVKNRKGTTNGAIRNAVRRALFPEHVTA